MPVAQPKKNKSRLTIQDAPTAQPWERRTRRPMEIDIDDIFLPACQRVQMPNSESIEKHFEISRLDRPIVNIRTPRQDDPWERLQSRDAKYALTDGYQRITALRKLGFTKVAVETIEASVEFENWLFRHQDKTKSRLSRSNMYDHFLSTGDPMWMAMDEIVKRNGFYVPTKISKKLPNDIVVNSPTGIEDCFKYDRQGVVLNRTLKIISNCWSGYDKAAHQDIIRGVGKIVKDYGNKITPEVEDTWRRKIQVGALLEAASQQGSQIERANKIAGKLRKTGGIRKRSKGIY